MENKLIILIAAILIFVGLVAIGVYFDLKNDTNDGTNNKPATIGKIGKKHIDQPEQSQSQSPMSVLTGGLLKMFPFLICLHNLLFQ